MTETFVNMQIRQCLKPKSLRTCDLSPVYLFLPQLISWSEHLEANCVFCALCSDQRTLPGWRLGIWLQQLLCWTYLPSPVYPRESKEKQAGVMEEPGMRWQDSGVTWGDSTPFASRTSMFLPGLGGRWVRNKSLEPLAQGPNPALRNVCLAYRIPKIIWVNCSI